MPAVAKQLALALVLRTAWACYHHVLLTAVCTVQEAC